MKFDFSKLGRVDGNAKNIFKVSAPYYLINKNEVGTERKKVIFFGCDFRNLPRDVNVREFIKITNRCLDFIRRECAGYELYYKPHPAETDEFKFLNLDSFEIIKDKAVGEIFLYKNLNQIKYVFSMGSTASLIACSLGLNSYVFTRLFKSAFGEVGTALHESYLRGMPESFFISDLNLGLRENKIVLQRDNLFEKHLAESLNTNRGTVWFIVVDPGFLLLMILLSKLIKNISPNRKVGMIIMRHERWNSIDMGEIMEDFDDLVFFPKVNYAFKLANLLNLVKIVWRVKKFKVNPEDILCGIGLATFLENCFISYFKNNLRIGVTTEQIFELTHYFEPPLDISDFEIKRTVILFNNVIEPLLGLHKGVRLRRPSGKNGGYFTRYRDAVNKIFDIVYLVRYI